jgi:hypothetical protein
MNMHLGSIPDPCSGRNHHRQHNAADPLDHHQQHKQAVGINMRSAQTLGE